MTLKRPDLVCCGGTKGGGALPSRLAARRGPAGEPPVSLVEGSGQWRGAATRSPRKMGWGNWRNDAGAAGEEDSDRRNELVGATWPERRASDRRGPEAASAAFTRRQVGRAASASCLGSHQPSAAAKAAVKAAVPGGRSKPHSSSKEIGRAHV